MLLPKVGSVVCRSAQPRDSCTKSVSREPSTTSIIIHSMTKTNMTVIPYKKNTTKSHLHAKEVLLSTCKRTTETTNK